jgi:nucleoside-diphosphate-sugar epimerase
MRILVIESAGFTNSPTVLQLTQANHEVTVFLRRQQNLLLNQEQRQRPCKRSYLENVAEAKVLAATNEKP